MITVITVCFYFVSHGAHASVHDLEMLIMVKKIHIWGNKVIEGQKEILAKKMNKRRKFSPEKNNCMFYTFLRHSVLNQIHNRVSLNALFWNS